MFSLPPVTLAALRNLDGGREKAELWGFKRLFSRVEYENRMAGFDMSKVERIESGCSLRRATG